MICLKIPLSSMMNRPLKGEKNPQSTGNDATVLDWCIQDDLVKDARHPSTSPVGNALILFQHTVICRDGTKGVSYQWNLHVTETTLLPRCVDPVRQSDPHGKPL